jgi:hypothetical protein
MPSPFPPLRAHLLPVARGNDSLSSAAALKAFLAGLRGYVGGLGLAGRAALRAWTAVRGCWGWE